MPNIMKAQNQHGFTIIEISLFLGVSTLLMVGLLSGITIAVNRQRFTDSVQSTQAFLQKQFSETINVVNNRPSSQAGADCGATGTNEIGATSCIVIGRALYFQPNDDKVISYPIVSQDPSLTDLDSNSDEWTGISQLSPKIEDNVNAETYDVPWAAKTTSITRVSGINVSHSATLNSGEVTGGTKGNDINYIILLRSPYSGRTFIYGYSGGSGDIGDASNKLKDETKAANQSDFLVCVHSQDIGSAYAGVYFTGAGSQDSVVTRFKYDNNNCVN